MDFDFLNKIKNMSSNKKHKFEPIIKSERRFSVTTNKNYGLCFYLEGQLSSEFRRRLYDLHHTNSWLIVYKKKGNKLILDGDITDNINKINYIENTFEIIKKIPLNSVFYIDIYFEDKKIAEEFESLFKKMYIEYINERYKEYKNLILKEKEDWLK